MIQEKKVSIVAGETLRLIPFLRVGFREFCDNKGRFKSVGGARKPYNKNAPDILSYMIINNIVRLSHLAVSSNTSSTL